MNLIYFHLFSIILISSIDHLKAREWVDIGDMVDSRILENRYRHTTAQSNKLVYKEVKIVYNQIKPSEDRGDSVLDYIPKNPFPSTDSCSDKSLQLEDASNRPDKSDQLECISNKLKENTHAIRSNEIQTTCNQIDNGQCGLRNEQNEKNDKFLRTCLNKNKELTEDLVCFRNLKSLYFRYFIKIQTVISLMQEKDKKIEIHPYSPEFRNLIKILQHNNCLSAVDDFEQLISKLDQFLYKIEPVDYSKQLIYGGIFIAILFCFYYVYRYSKVRTLLFTLLFFMIYAHEYYYLILAKKAETSHELRKFHNCLKAKQETGFFSGIFNFFFGGFHSSISFKGDECDINEDYLYIDAAFKVGPLTPLFTVLPKLFTKSMIILFENSAIAFRKFSSQLPIFHAYPILIIFLALIIIIIYLIIEWHVKLRRVEQEYRIQLARLTNTSERLTIGRSRPIFGENSSRLIFGANSSSFSLTSAVASIFATGNETERFEPDESLSRKLTRSRSLDFIPDF